MRFGTSRSRRSLHAGQSALATLVGCALSFVEPAPADAQPSAETADTLPTDEEGREWFEQRMATCMQRLADVLDASGYTHELRFEWNISDPSIVDATEALQRSTGADVVLLTDGLRMHAVTTFISHARTRHMVRRANALTERQSGRNCVFMHMLREQARLRRWHRATLLGVAACAFAGFGLVFRWAVRRRSDG